MNVWSIFGSIGLDVTGLERGLDQAEASVQATGREMERATDAAAKAVDARLVKLGQSFQRLGSRMTLAVSAPLAAIGVLSVRAASDMEETVSKMQTVYRDLGDTAEQTAQRLQDGYGLSSRAARQLLGDTGDLLTGFGFTQESALDLANQVAELGVDLASFTNYQGGAEGAAQALTKALLGETESLKMLGIAIRQEDVVARAALLTQQGMVFETERQARAYATLTIAQEQSKNAIGDYQRTSEGFANSLRRLWARLEDVRVKVGELILPIATRLVNALERAAEWVLALDDSVVKWAIGIGAALAAIGPLLVALGTFLTILPSLRAGIVLLNAALTPLRVPLLVITGLVIALASAWSTNFLGIRDLTKRAVEYIGERIGTLVLAGRAVIENWETIAFAWGEVLASIAYLAQQAGHAVAAGWEVSTLAVQRAFTAMFRFVEQGLSGMAGGIIDGINAVIGGINRTLKTDIPLIEGIALTAWANIDAETAAKLDAAQGRVSDAQAAMAAEVRYMQATVATTVDVIRQAMEQARAAAQAGADDAGVAQGSFADLEAALAGTLAAADALADSIGGATGLAGALGDGTTEAERLAAQLAEIERRLGGIAMLRARHPSITGWDPFRGAPGLPGNQTARREARPTGGSGWAGSPRGDAIDRAMQAAEAAALRAREVAQRIYTDSLREGHANAAARERLREETDALAARAAGFANAIDLNITALHEREAMFRSWDPFAGAPGLPGDQTGRRAWDPRVEGMWSGSPRGAARAATWDPFAGVPSVVDQAGRRVWRPGDGGAWTGSPRGDARAEAFAPQVSDRGRRRDAESDGGLAQAAAINAAADAEARAALARFREEQDRHDRLMRTLQQARDAVSSFGTAVLETAKQRVPALGAAIDGFVTGGPLGALSAMLAQLLGESEVFGAILETINKVFQPVVAALETLLDALWPLIDVALALVDGALQPLVAIIENVVAPVFNFVARLIATIWNGIARALNAILGWTGLRLREIDLDGTAPRPEPDPSKDPRTALLDDRRPEAPRAQGFGGTPQAVQFAVATPLVEASLRMMDAATLLNDNLAALLPTGPGMGFGAMPPFTSALERLTPVLERLLAEGVSISVATAGAAAGAPGSATAALRGI